MATAEKGTRENPYTMEECDKMLDEGTWPGGWVKDGDDEPFYVLKEVSVHGCCGYCGCSGSRFEFSTGSTDWHYPDENSGSDEGGAGTGTGTGNSGNTGGNSNGNSGGGGGSTGGPSGSGSIKTEVMTEELFEEIKRLFAITSEIESLLQKLYDSKKLVTFSGQDKVAFYDAGKGILAIRKVSVENIKAQEIFHELTHYVQDSMERLSNKSCNSEFEAYMMSCYLEVSRDRGYAISVFENNEDSLFIRPFYDYWHKNSEKPEKYHNWDYFQNLLDTTDWNKHTNTFRDYWIERGEKKAYTEPYDSTKKWCWKELFKKFGIFYDNDK